MKNELPCAVVRDLLPSYIEKLTEEETAAAVKNHLEKCQDCRSRYESMAGENERIQTDSKEVDYLKTVRKKNRKKIVVSVLAAGFLVLAAVSAKLFLIGTAVDGNSVAVQIAGDTGNSSLTVSFINIDSATVLTGIKVRQEADVIDISARKVLVSPVHPPEEISVPVDLNEIREIRAFGETVWKNGTEIEHYTIRLMKNKTQYAGNASAVNRLISSMDLDAPHTLELQTGREPYGITIHFSDTIQENRRFMIEGHACLLLSMIDNLGEVYWDDPGGYSGSLKLQDAEKMISACIESYNQSHGTRIVPLKDIRDYAEDSYHLQVLRNILGI